MKRIVALIILCVSQVILFARAGGGISSSGGRSSSGYSGGYYGYGYGYHHHHGHYDEKELWLGVGIAVTLALVLVLITIFGFALLVRKNNKKTKAKINNSKKFDTFWDEQKMQEHVKEVFPKIQSAWMSRELRDVSEFVTPKFIGTFQPMLNNYKKRQLVNVIDNVRIDRIDIVDIYDDADNNKDGFTAYIKGEMRDYLVRESGGFTTIMDNDGTDEFEDLYVFRRKDNRWLLDHIVNDPGSSDFKINRYGFGR